MAVLTKKLTQVLYIGTSPLTLANLSTGIKAAIKFIRQVNTAGTGYASFNPASGVNSLSTAPAATASLVGQYIVETIASSGISVNLGVDWALAPADVVRLVFTVPASQTNFSSTPATIASADAGTYIVESTTGLTVQSYAKNGSTVPTPALGALLTLTAGDTFAFVATTTGAAGTITLIKQ